MGVLKVDGKDTKQEVGILSYIFQWLFVLIDGNPVNGQKMRWVSVNLSIPPTTPLLHSLDFLLSFILFI